MSLNDINSLSHTKCNYKCHDSICAKAQRESILQREEDSNREILRELCE